MKRPPETSGQGGGRGKRDQFYTDNPRHLRALAALLTRPQPREALDRAAGCSNAPDLVAELRRRGLSVPCDRAPVIDRDGNEVQRGIYHLTASDRRKVRAMNRQRGIIAPHLLGLLFVAVPVVVALVARWAI